MTAFSYGGRGRGGPGGADFGDGLILGPGSGRGRPQPQQGGGQRLIIPGQRGPAPGAPGRLVIPDQQQQGTFGGPGSALDVGDSVTTPTPPNRYRPPAGFMDENLQEDVTANMDPNEMLNRLRARAGKWHQLAKFLPSLHKQGFDSSIVDEATGITPALQDRWMVAGTVHESLRLSGQMSPEMLETFDQRGEYQLYPFRFLGLEARVAAAKYIVEKGLEPDMCDILARSMKEWERRVSERVGFTDHPGDCLAFKYFRDALEMRRKEEVVEKVEKGLAVAVTDGARARLREVLEEEEEGTESGPATTTASLMILRLNPEELGFRPLVVLGRLGEVEAGGVEAAPKATQQGAFSTFTISGAGASHTWVALPQWRALTLAKHPVALEIADCAAVKEVLLGTKAKTDEDRKRLSGPGLLVLDKEPTPADRAVEEAFYLAPRPDSGSGRLMLVDGQRLRQAGATAVATVLFLARPPQREAMQAAAETANLLQV
eukprot:CAMPEP_0202902946 /NCGR_PEP_ID=MMETSP1392-20130828/19415_1 /ASSEMBLY_ACC=CAM_ASM_000868 /TAXON_ID=225041 /ORGANISM="Chlamydomonas chlamydogama, Strain SAG 11-48b" /LENGTH=487 /DNA_ID=CAMNT_0049589829 /DNA_START=253 /DNA_END=1716 /DNA_ORIENTATION=+